MNSPAITVRNLQRRVSVDVADLEKFAAKALAKCLKLRKGTATTLTKSREISVLLVSDRRMSELHWQFLRHRGPTDVLTFEHGEIFISVATAKRNARAFGNSFDRELRLYVIHGLLHLHGLDDRTERDAREMEAKQSKLLRRLN